MVVDKLTKYTHFIMMYAEVTALQLAEVLLKQVVKYSGLPSRIIGDHDPRWASSIWNSLERLFGTRLALSTS